jgi:hypothetical protein
VEEMCFLRGLFREVISETRFGAESGEAHMEAGSNTSTVVLWVIGGNKKGTQCLGV